MPKPKSDSGLPWNALLLGAAVLAIFAGWFFLPLQDWMKVFTQWVEGLGVLGGVLFALIYIAATLALAPGSILTIAAGLAFGIAWGLPLVLGAATIGASLAFLVGRYLARDTVKGFTKKRPKLQAVDQAVSEEGWKVVVLLRLSPLVPFNLQNYFFGVTDIAFPSYVWATLIGIVPGTLLYLYVGALGKAAAGGGGQGGALKWALFAAGLVATVVLTVFVTRKAKAKLGEKGVKGE